MKSLEWIIASLIFITIFSLFVKKEAFAANDISINLMSPQGLSAVVSRNQDIYYSPCDVVTKEGVRYRFQAGDKPLNWYAVKGVPNACSVEVQSDDVSSAEGSCTTANTTIYDPNIVQAVNWDDSTIAGKRCTVTFKSNLTSSQLDSYLTSLPSFQLAMQDDNAYVNVFNQSINFVNSQKKVDIPSPFVDKMLTQSPANMARTVCFWAKLWWTSADWRLLGSVGQGEWWERKPAIYVSNNNDTWLQFAVTNTDPSFQNTINGGLRIGYNNCFVTCRIYLDTASNSYKMTSKYTMIDSNCVESVDAQTVGVDSLPKLIDSLEVANRYMLFGSGNCGFSIWNWRLYSRYLTDVELNSLKDSGKTQLSYLSGSGQIIPKYYLIDAHMDSNDSENFIIFPAPQFVNNSIHNEQFTRDMEQGVVNYICTAVEPDRIYKLVSVQRNVYGYWTYISLADVDEKGVPTGKPVSQAMLYDIDTPNGYGYTYKKLVIGLSALPINFKTTRWLSPIYPTKTPQ